MILGLANASIRKHLKQIIAISHKGSVCHNGEHSTLGKLFSLLDILHVLLSEIDAMYDTLYATIMNMPTRYEVPDVKEFVQLLKASARTKYFNMVVAFATRVHAYVLVHDGAFNQCMNMTQYKAIEKRIVEQNSKILVHIVGVIPEREERCKFVANILNEDPYIVNISHAHILSRTMSTSLRSTT